MKKDKLLFTMQEHGEILVQIEGMVIHAQPQYATNDEAIMRNSRLVLEAAADLGQWIFWADPGHEFALTPTSLLKARDFIISVDRIGCIAFALTLSSPLMRVVAGEVENNITIPFLASPSKDEIRAFIKEQAAGAMNTDSARSAV